MNYPKGIADIVKENPKLIRKTLLYRAAQIPLSKLGKSWIVLNKEEEDKLTNPLYWKTGKKAKNKNDYF